MEFSNNLRLRAR